jgi:UDPglucose 6-dehydrogenase
MKIKNICCIGAGYVGGPTMAVIALKCPEIKINIVDINKNKIDQWNSKNLDKLPVFEPGLSEIISEVRDKNLFFRTDVEECIDSADMVFMAVNTPTKTEGEGKGMAADLKYIESCARTIAKASKTDKIIVEKSTLPVRTAEKIIDILNENKKVNFQVLSNPEFLAEGTAIKDLFKSDRVLIGGQKSREGENAVNNLSEIYERWIPKNKILKLNIWSSELSKIVSNAMLAQRISSINSISSLCEKTGADIEEVALAVGMDKRIGPDFLKASVGFGGSCFKKDILNLVYMLKYYGLLKESNYWKSIVEMNSHQTQRFANKIIESINQDTDKIVSIFGWAFKKNTNDSRESASIYLAKILIENHIKVNVYDPMVSKERIIDDLNQLGLEANSSVLEVFKSPDQAAESSSGIAFCTEWDEFKTLDFKTIFKLMGNSPWIFDGRNTLNINLLEECGFNVYSIGK